MEMGNEKDRLHTVSEESCGILRENFPSRNDFLRFPRLFDYNGFQEILEEIFLKFQELENRK